MTPFRRFPRALRLAPALLLAVAGAGPAGASEVVERVLIHVNSRIITQGLFDSRYEQLIREEGPPASSAKAEETRKKLLEELVNEALLEDRARDLDLITTDKEVEDQIRRLKEQNKVTTDEEFDKALASSGLNVERLRDQIRRSMTLQRVVGREVNSKVDYSDDALRATYEREKETWRIPEKAHLAEILISKSTDSSGAGTAEKRAREAADALKAGTKFEQVVKDVSDGATKNRGGDLGWVARGELVPEIDRAVFALPVGTVSDPISTKFGWHLVKVVEKAPVSYRPFTEVKAELLKREQETQFQKRLNEYLDKIRQDAVIRVSPEAAPYYTAPAVAARDLPSASGTAWATEAPPPERTTSRSARGVEITAMGGYRVGGTTSSYGNTYIDRIGVPSAVSFGASVEVPFTDAWSAEALWSHQDTELRADFGSLPLPEGGGDRRLSHLNVDTFQIGALLQSGSIDSRARLYVDLLLGATLLTPAPPFSDLLRFSLSIGGGVKYWPTDHFGARLGLRWMPVYLNSTTSGPTTCDPLYGCYYYYYDTMLLSQGDAHIGVMFKF